MRDKVLGKSLLQRYPRFFVSINVLACLCILFSKGIYDAFSEKPYNIKLMKKIQDKEMQASNNKT